MDATRTGRPRSKPRRAPGLTGDQLHAARHLWIRDGLASGQIASRIGATAASVLAAARLGRWSAVRAELEQVELEALLGAASDRAAAIRRSDAEQARAAALAIEAARIGYERLVALLSLSDPADLPTLLRLLPSLEQAQRVARTAQGRPASVAASMVVAVGDDLSVLDRLRASLVEPGASVATEPFPGDEDRDGAAGGPG